MNTFELKLIFDQARSKTVLCPNLRAVTRLRLNGQHAHQVWDDRRLNGLTCQLDVLCVERVWDGWDKGGWFKTQLRSKWIAVHGEADCLGRVLIRKNLSPELDETYGPIGFPLEIALMLPEEDAMDTITQIRYGLSCDLKTSISLTLGSDSLPKHVTEASDLDVSEDFEYPIVRSVIEDVTG